MRTPPETERTLHEFDPGLRCRWAEALGRYSIERRHGFAGIRADGVLGVLHSRWKQLERESDDAPLDADLELQERKAYDAFIARRDGYQPLLYLLPRDLYYPRDILDRLAEMDIRRAGGALGFSARMKRREEQAAASRRAVRRDLIHDLADRALTTARAKKDFHASGGNPLLYPVAVPEKVAEARHKRSRARRAHEQQLLQEARFSVE